MKIPSLFIAAVFALGMQQPRSPQDIAADLERLSAEVKQLQSPVTPPEKLQAALDLGGEIHLQEGGVYAGSFKIRVSFTKLYADGASFTGSTIGPAIDILPGTNDVEVYDFTGTTSFDQQVILCGHNDASQTQIELVPKRIKIIRPTIPTYRGKRGIEINCAVEIDHPVISDLYDPANRDSQTIGVSNTPGPVWVHGAQLTGGTETFMVGGDIVKVPGMIQSDITLEDFSLLHPIGWRGSVPKKGVVKNLLEIKSCRRCIFRRGILDGSWKDGQDGYGLVVTPHAGGLIQDVLYEDLTVRNVAAVFNMSGMEYSAGSPPSTAPTSGVVIRRMIASASKTFGTTQMGIFAQMGNEVHDVTIDGLTFTGDGPSFISVYRGGALNPDSTPRPGLPMTSLTVTNSTFPALTYSIYIWGVANAGPTQNGVLNLVVTGNTISGASAALKKNLAANNYVN